MESLGSYLKRERELRNIPLSEVSENTFIKLEYLEAIESEHFEKLPGLTFVRGYLQSYAAYIGLKPEDVAQRFEQLWQRLNRERQGVEKNQVLFWVFAFLFLAAVAALVFYLLR